MQMTTPVLRDDFVMKHLVNSSEGNTPSYFPSNRMFIPGPAKLPEILFLTTFPPRECGIATFAQDLCDAIVRKFDRTFILRICPLESENEKHAYHQDVKHTLNTDLQASYDALATEINSDAAIQVVVIQHEFGLFANNEAAFMEFLPMLLKPVITVFHTVLPSPNPDLKSAVQVIAMRSAAIVVMTQTSARILATDYGISDDKISLIPHGTHFVAHIDKLRLKEKYDLVGKKVLATFGLLSAGKNIESTLRAMPDIIAVHPEAMFLVIGKTHPTVVKNEGEAYRNELENLVATLNIGENVRFINRFVPLPELLECLQMTDVYLFTSKDPNQAVSGTFSYAISCGCPVISTPIPHAQEVLRQDTGIMIDFESPQQLSAAAIRLLSDTTLSQNLRDNGLHRMASTAWENASIAYADLFQQVAQGELGLHYATPDVNLDHVFKMTTPLGMIQFSKINQPDIASGYTLDDNARALIACCQHFKATKDVSVLPMMTTYLRFIQHCMQDQGYFLNYVNEKREFTPQNEQINLADANGRAIWALGYLSTMGEYLPEEHKGMVQAAENMMEKAIPRLRNMHSTRAMAFAIKGLYYRNAVRPLDHLISLINELASRLVQMYRHESQPGWRWFESYLTYANACLPEAMLCAGLATHDQNYLAIAKSSFDFLLDKTLLGKRLRVISNQNWVQRGAEIKSSEGNNEGIGGEQPIDVAYTIFALEKFAAAFPSEGFMAKMEIAFSWFLGNNHLQQIIYNPCTGGCYDGLEREHVNLNQGAESTLSYLMARLTMDKARKVHAAPSATAQQRLVAMPRLD